MERVARYALRRTKSRCRQNNSGNRKALRITPPGPKQPVDVDAVAAYFEHSALAEKYGEATVREKIAEMAESIQGGAATTDPAEPEPTIT